jgi:NAD+ kinase
MKFAIYGQAYKTVTANIINRLLVEFRKIGATAVFETEYYKLLLENHIIEDTFDTFDNHSNLPDDVNFFISIGGDGTMLRAANYVKSKNIPIVGINAGRLGFLANIQQDAIEHLISKLINNEYQISKRTLLTLSEGFAAQQFKINFALNEITISRKNTTSMITIKTYINNEFLATYWADGIIISTPTGSTGYSLSCGGPIITPDSNCVVITPIAPHNLTTRPLIINDKSKIKMKIESREPEFLVSVDSETQALPTETEINISLASHTVNMVVFPGVTFLKTLRNKLLWGEDVRN